MTKQELFSAVDEAAKEQRAPERRKEIFRGLLQSLEEEEDKQ